MHKKKCCVFTFARNEKVFLPIWLRYYSKYFSGDDIYVIDHETSDGSIDVCQASYPFNVIREQPETWDEIWRTDTAQKMQARLLEAYDFVLFTDVDEIIIPNPRKYRDLRDYIEKFSGDYVACTGYGLFHARNEEPPLDLERPILSQRRYWYPDCYYNKPLLSRKPLQWAPGFHTASNTGIRMDRDLWLLHLHKMDFDLCWEKHQWAAQSTWSEAAIKANYGWQYRITRIKKFERFFDRNHMCPWRLKKMGWKFILQSFCWMWLGVLIGLKRWMLKILLKQNISFSLQQCLFPLIRLMPKYLREKAIL